MSLVEAVANVVIGPLVAVATQIVVAPFAYPRLLAVRVRWRGAAISVASTIWSAIGRYPASVIARSSRANSACPARPRSTPRGNPTACSHPARRHRDRGRRTASNSAGPRPEIPSAPATGPCIACSTSIRNFRTGSKDGRPPSSGPAPRARRRARPGRPRSPRSTQAFPAGRPARRGGAADVQRPRTRVADPPCPPRSPSPEVDRITPSRREPEGFQRRPGFCPGDPDWRGQSVVGRSAPPSAIKRREARHTFIGQGSDTNCDAQEGCSGALR